MELSGLSNEVLRLLLAQNNLLITGSREQLIKRFGSILPSNPSATRTRNADASASAAKRPRTNRQEPGSSDVQDEPRDPTPEDELSGDTPTELNDNNPEEVQDGGRNEAPPVNSSFDPANLATLIGNIVGHNFNSVLYLARRSQIKVGGMLRRNKRSSTKLFFTASEILLF